jgi:putative oxidoreductase
VALGLLNPIGSLGIVAAMLMAIVLVHWGRLWITENGTEYHLVLIASSLAVAIAGPGAFSLDAAFGIALPAPATLLVGLAS